MSKGDQNGGSSVVFYESEYFYSTMPNTLPSDSKNNSIASPTHHLSSFANKPQTPSHQVSTRNGLLSVAGSSVTGSTTSNMSGSKSVFIKPKRIMLDLDDLVKDSPVTD
jgi:hypothetical protein